MKTPLSSSFLTRDTIIVAAFFVFFLFLLYQGSRLITPFISPIVWAGIVVLILYPVYKRLLGLVKGRKNVAAGVMTLVTLVLVIGPAVLLLMLLAGQAVELYADLSDLVESGRLLDYFNRLKSSAMGFLVSHPYLADLDIRSQVMKGLSTLSTTMASQIGAILKNVLLSALNLFIMLFVIFFFFRDGKEYAEAFIDVLPFPDTQKIPVITKIFNTFSAVMNGLFLVALLQGFMTGLGFLIFSLPFPVLWGFAAAIASLIPFGGSALVWIPGVIYLFFIGSAAKAVLLTVWGIVMVSLPDNFLRPLFIGKKAELPTFFLFLGILGGIQIYGFLGVFFGPIVVTLLIAFVQIYKEEYAGAERQLPE